MEPCRGTPASKELANGKWGVLGRVGPEPYGSGPPTDPDVQVSCIRFLGSRVATLAIAIRCRHVETIVRDLCPVGLSFQRFRDTAPFFPPRGPSGWFPRFIGTIRALRLPIARPASLVCLASAVPLRQTIDSISHRWLTAMRPWAWTLLRRLARPALSRQWKPHPPRGDSVHRPAEPCPFTSSWPATALRALATMPGGRPITAFASPVTPRNPW